MEQRECRICDRPFTPNSPNQQCCPPSDEERKQAKARGARQARSRCARRWSNHLHRGTSVLHGKVAPRFDCAECGKRCTPGQNVAHHATKFCGRTCKRAWHASNPSAESIAKRRREKRWASALRKLEKAAAGTTGGGRRVWRCGPCAECGRSFASQYRDATCCSAACINRCQRRRNRRKYRARHGSDSHRARARRYGVAYEPIDREQVFRDDGWRCGLCGDPTDPQADPCAPLAPSLDHIVPLSRGGPHNRSNVQCAHFECNWLKRDALELPAAA